MCGRYSITTPSAAMSRLFRRSGSIPFVPARYNVAPGQDVPVVRAAPDGGTRELAMLRWGLIPSWAREGAKPLINARGETVAEKPSFRSAFKRRRCLLPADGFYEWRRPENGPKQPFNIVAKDGGPFVMAGIWEVWAGPDGSEVPTCAIITTAANATLAPIHHRMPVILAPADWRKWLETPEAEARDLLSMLAPAPDDFLRAYEISTRVNRAANDGPELIAPVTPEPRKETANVKPAKKPPEQGSLF